MRISDWSSDVCSFALLAVCLPKRPGPGGPFRFGLLGVLLFAVFIAYSLVLLEQLRHFDAATMPFAIGLGTTVLVALLLLIWREKVAPDPLLPVTLLRDPTTWRSDALAACHGAVLVSLLTFLPTIGRAPCRERGCQYV